MVREEGFAVIPIWLVRDPDVDTYTKMVYLALSSRVGPDGTCFPSQARLAMEASCSERQVRRALTTLKERGLIEQWLVKTEHGRRAHYRLLTDRFGRGGPDSQSGPIRTDSPGN